MFNERVFYLFFYNILSYNNFEFFPNNCFQFCFVLNLYNLQSRVKMIYSQETSFLQSWLNSHDCTVKKQVFYSHDCIRSNDDKTRNHDSLNSYVFAKGIYIILLHAHSNAKVLLSKKYF